MQRLPSAAPSSTLPSPSTSSGLTPKNGRVAEPGLRSVAPGSGVIRMPPVSVCHQVSTIGSLPVADDVEIPLPGFRIDRLADRAEQRAAILREVFFTWLSPAPISARIAVGAV